MDYIFYVVLRPVWQNCEGLLRQDRVEDEDPGCAGQFVSQTFEWGVPLAEAATQRQARQRPYPTYRGPAGGVGQIKFPDFSRYLGRTYFY